MKPEPNIPLRRKILLKCGWSELNYEIHSNFIVNPTRKRFEKRFSNTLIDPKGNWVRNENLPPVEFNFMEWDEWVWPVLAKEGYDNMDFGFYKKQNSYCVNLYGDIDNFGPNLCSSGEGATKMEALINATEEALFF